MTMVVVAVVYCGAPPTDEAAKQALLELCAVVDGFVAAAPLLKISLTLMASFSLQESSV